MADKVLLGETDADFVAKFNALVDEFNSQGEAVKQVNVGTETYTPVNGVLTLPASHLTEEDITNIVNGIVERIPVYNGEVL